MKKIFCMLLAAIGLWTCAFAESTDTWSRIDRMRTEALSSLPSYAEGDDENMDENMIVGSVLVDKNGNRVEIVDAAARKAAQANAENIAKNTEAVNALNEEKVNKHFGVENAGAKLVVGEDGNVTAKKNAVVTYRPELEGIWNSNTNSVTSSDDYWYFHTDLLPLDGVTKIKASFKMGNSGYGLAFFDSTQAILPSISIVGKTAGSYEVVEMEVPAGAAYCALSHYGGGKGDPANIADAYITLYSGDGEETGGLNAEQISALNEMFKVCAYVASADSAYAAFCAAFGITGQEGIDNYAVYPVYTLNGAAQGYAYGIDGKMTYVNGAEKYPKFSILGDSISTFEGYIQEADHSWYPKEPDFNNVQSVDETWWKMFEAEFGSAVDVNNSYSGSPIAYDDWNDGVDSGAKTWSFIGRSGNVGNPDLILVFGGTNDSSIINSHGGTVGEYKYSGWTEDDLTAYRPALAYLLNKLKTDHPSAQIVLMLGGWIIESVKDSTHTICDYYNVPCVELTGVSMANGHPDKDGMVTIKNQLIAFMAENGLLD